MKLKYIDKKNCFALLNVANLNDLSRRLDVALQQANDRFPNLPKVSEKLILKNHQTLSKYRGSRRLNRDVPNLEIAISKERLQQRETNLPLPSMLTILINEYKYINWKIFVPIQFLLKSWGDANQGYQCYTHIISRFQNPYEQTINNEFTYAGITGRNWLLRFNEHLSEMNRGSNVRFKTALRESLGMDNILIHSSLEEVNLTYEEAMNWEEKYVDDTHDNGFNCLNTISGGFKGLRELHKHRIIKSMDISLEERDCAIAEYIRQNPRKGIPNPFMAELWKNDEFYLKVNEGRKDRLSVTQVRNIRQLAKDGISVEEITNEVDALNDKQVKSVIDGKTYQRIK